MHVAYCDFGIGHDLHQFLSYLLPRVSGEDAAIDIVRGRLWQRIVGMSCGEARGDTRGPHGGVQDGIIGREFGDRLMVWRFLQDGLHQPRFLRRVGLRESAEFLAGDGIQFKRETYFDKVVTAHDALGLRGAARYGNSAVQWLARSPTVAPHEVLIYFMPFGTTIATNGKIEMGKPPAGTTA